MMFWKRLVSDKMAVLCMITIALVVVAGVGAPWFAPHDPTSLNIMNKYAGISLEYPLGTDQLGRCNLSRLLYGIRTTILFAVITTAITITIGTLLGIISGYFRGKVDEVIMRICDMMLSFPAEVMILAIVGILGPGLLNVVVANIIAKWAWYTRMIRTTVIQYTDKNYIRFAKVSGCGTGHIMRKTCAAWRFRRSRCLCDAGYGLGHPQYIGVVLPWSGCTGTYAGVGYDAE